jgi:transposase-like protein
MLIAGRFAVGNSPFLRGWQQEYMKAHGSMPPQDKVMDFLTSVVQNESIPMQNKQAELRMLDQMQRFAPEVRSVVR